MLLTGGPGPHVRRSGVWLDNRVRGFKITPSFFGILGERIFRISKSFDNELEMHILCSVESLS